VLPSLIGTFVGAPEPEQFCSDLDYARTRWLADPTAAFGAELDAELVGSNFATRWGSVGFFGPLTVCPDLWDRGIGTRPLDPIMECFATWRIQHARLFTFAHSPKHLGLYQKYAFWPRFLTAIMSKPVPRGESSARWATYAAKLRGSDTQASDVAAWPRQAGDESFPDRIAGTRHDEWDRARGVLGGADDRPAACHNPLHLETDQLGRQVGESLVLPLRPSLLNDEVLAPDVAELAQTLPEGLAEWKGEAQSTYPASFDRTWNAALGALQDANLQIKDTERDGDQGTINAVQVDDKTVIVALEPAGPGTTSVKIRVGTFGDEEASKVIHRQIASRLGMTRG
jgi:Protein of unknown function (DUF3568)